MRLRGLQILALLILVSPSVAQACAVCFSGRSDEQREAFLITTGFLTFLPLMLLGFAVWVLIRRVRRIEAENDAVAERVRELARSAR
jgi:high-affinity Fe2+/Pb2+ permease